MATTSRRSFPWGICCCCGGGLFGPKISFRSEIDRDGLCCLSVAKTIAGTWRPFGVGSLTYATDARRIIRTEIISRKKSESGGFPT